MQLSRIGGKSKVKIFEVKDSNHLRAQTVNAFQGRVDRYFQKFL